MERLLVRWIEEEVQLTHLDEVSRYTCVISVRHSH